MKKVTVIGAGFSGLTLAYYLREAGADVTVFAPGPGLIQTAQTPDGLVETAANGLLGDANVEALFKDLGIEYAPANPLRRKRFIFWEKPRRWPLSIITSFKTLNLLRKLKSGSAKPRPEETVAEWATRFVNQEFLDRMLAPALQGVYAGDVNKLSATLILGSLFKGKKGGTVAPLNGMGELLTKLRDRLQFRGVHFNTAPAPLRENTESWLPLVIATGAADAAALLDTFDPGSAAILTKAEMLPLVTVTRFYDKNAKDPQGFGCLFPEKQNFNALGVLFNDCIFKNRGPKRSETWILGGALHPQVTHLTDEALLAKIDEDRARLTGHHSQAKATHITRWPKALPHVTVEWERQLRGLSPRSQVYLHGNYLGVLGLTGILERSKTLAKEILNG